MRAACRTLGGHADVDSVKATASYVAFRAFTSSARPGEELLRFLRVIRHSGVVFDALSQRGRRVEWGRCCIMRGTYNSYHGSVDTPIDGVDTGYHSLKQFHEDRVKCVDTVPGSVDTRPSLQKTQLPDWDSASTQPVAVSTLDPVPRRPVLRKWDSVSTHSLGLESSCSGCFLGRRAQGCLESSCSSLFLESSCSRMFGVVVLQCVLYSRF
ncbi:hypothetical protein Taro_020744 [Colocasia esculenta]|uniref:Uncharacterized protein n=1 Tax=Colocasia esculenta TaxID=4460 RepID=A0A843UX55_COLES|nr:hypothetical protein [Colocasia esculenta]